MVAGFTSTTSNAYTDPGARLLSKAECTARRPRGSTPRVAGKRAARTVRHAATGGGSGAGVGLGAADPSRA